MLKITPRQAERVNRLVSELCANCDQDGNCVLLDDGEAHRCVQLISAYGIYCNYFKNAVLPADKELHEEIQKQNHKQ
ncbi:MAG: cysteine-rich VLP domain-containing protein [Clostridia bacterium]|nr:cysteine-rich VLP domain-containing protein [Clostridia bacterium]